MFEEDLARNGASHGEHYETEEKERHSFSSARTADLPTKKTPSATRKMPIQRCDEIVSPKKSHDPIATIIWFVAARLKAMIKGTDFSAKSQEKRDPIIASIPNQIQKAKKLEVVYQGDTNCVSTPIFNKIWETAVRTTLIKR
jgi:hypothetical protein